MGSVVFVPPLLRPLRVAMLNKWPVLLRVFAIGAALPPRSCSAARGATMPNIAAPPASARRGPTTSCSAKLRRRLQLLPRARPRPPWSPRSRARIGCTTCPSRPAHMMSMACRCCLIASLKTLVAARPLHPLTSFGGCGCPEAFTQVGRTCWHALISYANYLVQHLPLRNSLPSLHKRGACLAH